MQKAEDFLRDRDIHKAMGVASNLTHMGKIHSWVMKNVDANYVYFDVTPALTLKIATIKICRRNWTVYGLPSEGPAELYE